MDRLDFVVTEEYEGRLDTAIGMALGNISRTYGQKLINEGFVKVDGIATQSKKQKVNIGQVVTTFVPEPEVLNVTEEDIPLDIVYEDEDLLVVNKPKGMVVHPAPGNFSGTLVNGLMHHCKDRLSSINGIIRPGIVHRIDKDTSGLLVVAKTNQAHEGLSKQFRVHSIDRKYMAMVYDNIKEDEGTINLPLGRDPKNRLRRWVTRENSKEAITHYKVLERFGKYTLIECQLETGRTHQIRVHMAYTNHPLLGDPLYGPKKKGKYILPADGQYLHAKSLGFVHPLTMERLFFQVEPPAYFKDFLAKCIREREV